MHTTKLELRLILIFNYFKFYNFKNKHFYFKAINSSSYFSLIYFQLHFKDFSIKVFSEILVIFFQFRRFYLSCYFFSLICELERLYFLFYSTLRGCTLPLPNLQPRKFYFLARDSNPHPYFYTPNNVKNYYLVSIYD